MSDYQRVIDNIRGILASSGTTPLDEVAAVAADFSQACDAVNERLRKCGELLRGGLRSEAIQQCEVEPNILNLLATLDFSELPDWNSYLQSHGFLPEQPLLMDVAAELNEAYAIEQPMATLLRRHRLLALGRAPLRDRLATLRKLARLDANNIVWQDDVRQYERARQQEIRRATDQEYRQGNTVAIEELMRDVQLNNWLEPPPAALVQQISDMHRLLVRGHGRSEMEKLETQLNDAFSQFDVTRGRALRERWNASAALARLPENDPLCERAAPALEWLDQQDRDAAEEDGYRAAVVSLEEALDNQEDRIAVKRRANAILAYQRPIPPSLSQRLQAHIVNLDRAQSHRVRLIVSATAAAGVLIACLIGYAVLDHLHAQQVAANVDILQTLLSRGEPEKAQKHLDALAASAPKIASDPQIQKMGIELAGRAHQEQVRVADFTAAIEAAEKAGVKQPDRKSLEEALRLAILDSEKARLMRLEKAVAEADLRRQNAQDDEFVRQLKELTVRIDSFDRSKSQAKELIEVRQALADLVTRSDGVSVDKLAQANAAKTKLETMFKATEQHRAADAALVEIESSAQNMGGFQRALEMFASRFPDTSRATDFKRVAAEAPLWETVETWNKFFDLWQKKGIAHLNAAEAKELHAAATKILADHPGFPVAQELRKRLPYLDSIMRRGGGEGSSTDSLNKFLNDPLIAGLWAVKVATRDPKDEKETISKYYLGAEPNIPKTSTDVRLNYIVDFSRSSTKSRTISTNSIQSSGTAPQSELSTMAMDELAALRGRTWEATYLRIIQAVIRDENAEPILKVLFLQKLLAAGCEGSDVMQSSFAGFQNTLNSRPIDASVRWMDPLNQDAQAERDAAIALLKRLPDVRPLAEEVAKNLKELGSPLGEKHEWVGWLLRTDDGGWICKSRDSSKRDGRLFVAISNGEGEMRWSEIGKAHGGDIKLDAANGLTFVEGRPVWLVEPHATPRGAANN